jgi:hypothetical protein
MPNLINPADFILSLTNIDFERNTEAAREKVITIQEAWQSSAGAADEKTVKTSVAT